MRTVRRATAKLTRALLTLGIHYPRSGRALVYVFPHCKDGRVVADVVKMQKGHTEGYEPNVTDKIIELAVSAKGGKIATGSWTPPPPPPPARGPFG
jgi:hypothetical protein